MLEGFARTASRLLDFRLDEDRDVVSPLPSGNNVYTLDVDIFRELVLPSPQDALQKVAGICGRAVYPLYRYVESTLVQDMDNLGLTLHGINPEALLCNDSDENGVNCDAVNTQDTLPTDRIPIAPTVPIPTIIVTPAPPQAREKSCWVPIQDSSFGTRLSVPTHDALNTAHPPMSPTRVRPVRFVRDWMYKNGHWCAVTPCPEEQERMGMYSRSVGTRRTTAASLRRENAKNGSDACQRASARGAEPRRK